MDADAAYLALRARDARFDGRLFVGVTSTGVYCRPVCRVRTPRREHCRFFESRAQAEAAAFRPCLKCRPEIAPGLSLMDASHALAEAAARWIDQAVHAGEPASLPLLARRLGVSDRHLRRIFVAAHGVSPHDYLTTQRLLLAKQLLTDTGLPVTQVALASGFRSLRRFNAAFAERYRLAPSRLRRAGAAQPDTAREGGSGSSAGAGAPLALRLAFRPPYDAAAMFGFFARRALEGVEQVDGLALRRTLGVEHGGQTLHGWITIGFVPERCELLLGVAPALAPSLGRIVQQVRQAFDLDADPSLIDPALQALPAPIAARPGLRLPGSFDAWETACRVVLGQQVTVRAASTLAARLVRRYGRPVATPFAGLGWAFPTAAAIAAADAAELGGLGIVRQRVRALQALAAALASGELALHRAAPVEPTLSALKALPGIGDWTAQLIALRVLGWPDAWPASDIGLLQALGTREARAAAALAEAWRPWRGYAVVRLWQYLEERKENEP